MQDLNRALADITNIRSQIAAGTLFRGFGPTVIAATGGIAVGTALLQSFHGPWLAATPEVYVLGWIAAATISVALIGAEMVARSRRHHGGMADAMIYNAVEQFLPAGFAGAALAAVLLRFAPESAWMLPGLWQLFVALGLFASLRTMPRGIALVGAWYFVAGIAVLIVSSEARALSPWAMGVPFAIGQALMALILHTASGETVEDHDHGR